MFHILCLVICSLIPVCISYANLNINSNNTGTVKLKKINNLTEDKLLNVFYEEFNNKHVLLSKQSNIFPIPFTVTLQDIDRLLISKNKKNKNKNGKGNKSITNPIGITSKSMVYGHNTEWRIVKRVTKKDTGEYWSSSTKHTNMTLGAAKHAFSNGYTIVINHAQLKSIPIYCAAKSLENLLGVTVSANIYLTPNHQQGFEIHMDWMDVLVVQVFGEKGWKVGTQGPYVAYPRADMIFKPNVTIDRDYDEEFSLSNGKILMTPGNSLFIPRGTFHEASTAWSSNASWLDDKVSFTNPNKISQSQSRSETESQSPVRSKSKFDADVLLTENALSSTDSLHVTFGMEVSNDYTVEMYLHNTIINHIRDQDRKETPTKMKEVEDACPSTEFADKPTGVCTENAVEIKVKDNLLPFIPYIPSVSAGVMYSIWHLIISQIASASSSPIHPNLNSNSHFDTSADVAGMQHDLRKVIRCIDQGSVDQGRHLTYNQELLRNSLMYIEGTLKLVTSPLSNTFNVLWDAYRMQLFNIRVIIIGIVPDSIPKFDQQQQGHGYRYRVIAEHILQQNPTSITAVELPNYLKGRFVSPVETKCIDAVDVDVDVDGLSSRCIRRLVNDDHSSTLPIYIPISMERDQVEVEVQGGWMGIENENEGSEYGFELENDTVRVMKLLSYVLSNRKEAAFTLTVGSGSSSGSESSSSALVMDSRFFEYLLSGAVRNSLIHPTNTNTNANSHSHSNSSSVLEYIVNTLSGLLYTLKLDIDIKANPSVNVTNNSNPSGHDMFNSYIGHLNRLLVEKQHDRYRLMKEWTGFGFGFQQEQEDEDDLLNDICSSTTSGSKMKSV